MFREDRWPFTPGCLTEIIDVDELSVIVSGCCQRLSRPLTLLDYEVQTGKYSRRIESINEKGRYENFCLLLRDEEAGYGKDRDCKDGDIHQAQVSLQEFYKTGNPYRAFTCYMGLIDVTYVICVRGHPLSVAFSGQYRDAGRMGDIIERIHRLNARPDAARRRAKYAPEKLTSLARDLPLMPADAPGQLAREAEHIQNIAEAEFERRKHQWEQGFLDRLRTRIGPGKVVDLNQLRGELRHVLDMVTAFCGCDYALFFGSVQEGDTVLPPLVSTGLDPDLAERLPHFNWKKAMLPMESFDIRTWELAGWYRQAGAGGIRGENSDLFENVGCIIPVVLGDRYRGALVVGPFADEVDLEHEQRFLGEVANIIGSLALTTLEVLYLGRERHRWRSTAMLLTHQLRTGLTPITTQIGRAKSLCSTRATPTTVDRVKVLLNSAEDLSIQLAQGANETLASHVLQVEPEDFQFERYPLSALVQNCANGYADRAQVRERALVVDASVESLPQAQLDVARLTIALGNIIDNAIKYSYPGTQITVRSGLDLINRTDPAALADAVIEVHDTGLPVPEKERERIFEQGTRGLTAAKMGQIPGSGLGLWEAQAVVKAHGGQIRVRCQPARQQRGLERAHHVVFAIRIPVGL